MSKLVRPSTPPCSKRSYQPRIVSSSNKRTFATSWQLRPLSKSTRAFARRVTRPAAKPSRVNAISALRSSSLRKPPRIMRPCESGQRPNTRHFVGFTASRSIEQRHKQYLAEHPNPSFADPAKAIARYRQRNKLKIAARHKVYAELRAERLVRKPCRACGN